MERATMTVLEVATYIGVSDDTIYALVKEKQIPFIRVRGRIVFRIAAIDAWMTEHEQQVAHTG